MAKDVQSARLPVSDRHRPCEGQDTSPSIPNHAAHSTAENQADDPLTEKLDFRCTVSEKDALRQKAEAAGVPISTLMREALGLVKAKRRKPPPRVDPKLIFAVARVGGNLNQLARWINRAVRSGHASTINAFQVASQLVAIERQLAKIIADHRDSPNEDNQP